MQDLPHNLIEAFKSTLESALNCDLALIVCDSTGEYDMQLKTTLDTLREMDFASPYLVVMNKSEGMDTSAFPYGSVAISAKENLGIDALKREILKRFSEDFLFCNLFVPYSALGEYGKVKPLLTEKNIEFTDDGQKYGQSFPPCMPINLPRTSRAETNTKDKRAFHFRRPASHRYFPSYSSGLV